MTSFIGHDEQIRSFLGALDSGKMHHGWILAGVRGIGKAGFAKQAAEIILSGERANHDGAASFSTNANSQTANLIAAGSHPDFTLLERLSKDDKASDAEKQDWDRKRNIGIDQVRGLQHMFATKPTFSNHRVVIIDAIDDLERSAANALLKNLEEPPQDTIFLLVSHAPDRLLPTIRSRCRMLRFQGLGGQQMEQVLNRGCEGLDTGEIKALINAADGSPGKALALDGLNLAEMLESMQRIATTGDGDNSIRSQLARTLSLKNAQARYEVFLQQVPSFIAKSAKQRQGRALQHALAAWQEAGDLAARANPLTLQKSAVIFQLGSLLASLARHKEDA